MRTRTRRTARAAVIAAMAAALLPSALPAQAAPPVQKQQIINAANNKCLILADYDVMPGGCKAPKAITSWELRDAGQNAVKIAGTNPQDGTTGCVAYDDTGYVFFGKCDSTDYGVVWKIAKSKQGEFYRLFADGRCLEADGPFDVKLDDCSSRAEQSWRLVSA